MLKLSKKLIHLLLIISVVSIAIMFLAGCSSSTKTNEKEPIIDDPNLVYGEILVIKQWGSKITINEFIAFYPEEFDLRVESKLLVGVWLYTLSFNYNLIRVNDLVNMLNFKKYGIEILAAEPWFKGNIIAMVNHEFVNGQTIYNTYETIDEIYRDYPDYGIRVTGVVPTRGIIRLTFDESLVDEFHLRRVLRDRPNLREVDFNGPVRIWSSGSIGICLHQQDDESINKFLESYNYLAGFDPKVIAPYYLSIAFDYTRNDEFEVLNTLIDDQRVKIAEFNWTAYACGGF